LGRLAAALAAAALAHDWHLVELNPVIAGPRGAVAVDAAIRRRASMPRSAGGPPDSG
jgi:hypothetical protein